MLSLPIELLILAALVLANGVLAMAETAVLSARKVKLKKLAAKGSVAAEHALAMRAGWKERDGKSRGRLWLCPLCSGK